MSISDWFRPRCPVPGGQKTWIEDRLAWLAGEFGLERMLRAHVIAPTVEYFPDPFDGTEAAASVLLRRVCGYIGVDPARIRLRFYSEEVPDLGYPFLREQYWHGTAGLYRMRRQGRRRRVRRDRIWIETSQLKNPESLAATLAHELAHVHLLGDRRLTGDEADHEPLTDLLTVYLGLGILTANSFLMESQEVGARGMRWSIRRQGYLSASMYGYALARFAWVRGECKPPWTGELRLDVRTPFELGLRFLMDTGDSSFTRSSGPP
jgi:hypothetical protein